MSQAFAWSKSRKRSGERGLVAVAWLRDGRDLPRWSSAGWGYRAENHSLAWRWSTSAGSGVSGVYPGSKQVDNWVHRRKGDCGGAGLHSPLHGLCHI